MKNINLKDFFNNSFVISIDDQRLKQCQNIFKYYNLQVPNNFDGFKSKKILNSNVKSIYIGAYNCGLSHAAIVRMAKALNLPFVVIFEDDAYPCTDIYNKLTKYLANIPDTANVIALGVSKIKNKHYRTTEYYNVYNVKPVFYGSHAYILYRTVYEKYIQLYDSNPKLKADTILSYLDSDIYVVKEDLFIQYNISKSNCGIVGYIFNQPNGNIGQISSVPPAGFDNCKKIFQHYILTEYAKKYNLNKDNKDECIIIGANQSLKTKQLSNYINTSDKTIIRLNRLPSQKLEEFYGNRTDLFFGCEYLKDLLKNVSNKVLIDHLSIINISKYFIDENDKWLTTGLICILLALQFYKKVYIFGFGLKNDINNSNQYISVNETIQKCHHLLGFEHRLINEYIESTYKNKLFRLEDINLN